MVYLVLRPCAAHCSALLHHNVVACQSFFWQVAGTCCPSFQFGIIAGPPISICAFNVLRHVWRDSALAIVSLLSFPASQTSGALVAGCVVCCGVEHSLFPLRISRRRVDDVVL